MTVENETQDTAAPPELVSAGASIADPVRTWRSKAIEIAIWAFVPLGAALGGLIVALVLGAPPPRVLAVTAAVAALTGAYFLFKPNPKLKVGRARAAGLIYSGLAMAMFLAPSPPPTSSAASGTREQVAAVAPKPKETPAQETERKAREAAQLAADAAALEEKERVDYVAKLEHELEDATPAKLLENADTPDTIVITVALFSVLASEYDDGASLKLSPEQEKARQKFKTRVVALQAQVFPELRNRYGSALAKKLWENDMEVTTVGTGFRTIRLTWGGFAANKNIAEFQRTAGENFTALRFKRVEYRWYHDADRYQYYTLDSPNDRDVVEAR